MKARPVLWLACDEKALAKLYPDYEDEILARVFGRTESSIIGKAVQLGLKKSARYLQEVNARCRFQKGQVPPNKGTRRPGYAPGRMASTQFKPGRPAQEAHNYCPIGSLKVDKDGYLVRKVTDDPAIAPARRWVGVHRLVWQQANGPIPRDHIVTFKPGRFTTELARITPDALELLTLRQNMARNTIHNLPPELVKVTQLRGALTRQINKRARGQ